MPRHMYLLGAGASYGSGPCTPFNPPLGANLFDELGKQFPRWAALNPTDSAKFRHDGFELGFAGLMDNRQDLIPGLMRDMARYFASFVPLHGNLYFEFVSKAVASQADCSIATLNYDLLLDSALEWRFGNWWLGQVEGRPHFIKPHGNINLVPNIGRGNTMKGMRVSGGASYFSGPSDVLSVARLLQWLDEQEPDADDNDLAPAFSIYAASKQVLWAPEIPEIHRQKFVEESANSDVLTVCGVRCVLHDKHIWDPLFKSPAELRFWAYGPTDAAEFEAWASNRQAKTIVKRGDFKDMVASI